MQTDEKAVVYAAVSVATVKLLIDSHHPGNAPLVIWEVKISTCRIYATRNADSKGVLSTRASDDAAGYAISGHSGVGCEIHWLVVVQSAAVYAVIEVLDDLYRDCPCGYASVNLSSYELSQRHTCESILHKASIALRVHNIAS